MIKGVDFFYGFCWFGGMIFEMMIFIGNDCVLLYYVDGVFVVFVGFICCDYDFE